MGIPFFVPEVSTVRERKSAVGGTSALPPERERGGRREETEAERAARKEREHAEREKGEGRREETYGPPTRPCSPPLPCLPGSDVRTAATRVFAEKHAANTGLSKSGQDGTPPWTGFGLGCEG